MAIFGAYPDFFSSFATCTHTTEYHEAHRAPQQSIASTAHQDGRSLVLY
jgi:hypothetical protein